MRGAAARAGRTLGGSIAALFIYGRRPGLGERRPRLRALGAWGRFARRLGSIGSRQGLRVVDVTGVGTALRARRCGNADAAAADAGAIYGWTGGASLGPAPSFTLLVAWGGDRLGSLGGKGQGMVLADFTGDLVLDAIAGASQADAAEVLDSGAIYSWQGRPGIAAIPIGRTRSRRLRFPWQRIGSHPDFTLAVSGAVANDNLGFIGGEEGLGIQLFDLTGDGVLDIVAGASNTTCRASPTLAIRSLCDSFRSSRRHRQRPGLSPRGNHRRWSSRRRCRSQRG